MPIARQAARLPKASAELVLVTTLTRAFLRTLPKKRRREFLRLATEQLALLVEYPNVIRLRPSTEDAEVAEAAAQANAYWRAALTVLIPVLSEE